MRHDEPEDQPTLLRMLSDYETRDADMPCLFAGVDEERKTDVDVEAMTPFVASTSDEDRHQSILVQDWKLANFRRNPVILYNHRRTGPDAIVIGRGTGKVENRGKPEARLLIDVTWDRGEHNPLATTIAAQYARKMLNAGSVGFAPGKRELRATLSADDPHFKAKSDDDSWFMPPMRYSRNELHEFSAVTVPSNTNAVALRSWCLEVEDPEEQARRLVTETMTRLEASDVITALRAADPLLLAQFRELVLGIPAPSKSTGFPDGFFPG